VVQLVVDVVVVVVVVVVGGAGGGVAALVVVVVLSVRSREVQPWFRSDGRLRNLRMRRSEVNQRALAPFLL